MRKAILLSLLILVAAVGARAQEMEVLRTGGAAEQYDIADIGGITFETTSARTLRLHHQGGVTQFLISAIDSLGFVGDNRLAVHEASGGVSEFYLAQIDSVTIGAGAADTVSIVYDGGTATVTNPLAGAGVEVDVTGARVTVTAAGGIADIVYELSGSTSDGMFKIYSDADLLLRLDGVDITSQDGPAINVQADETITVELASGTVNRLTDGATYADPPNDEDQKAAFFSEGQLIFVDEGSLVVTGRGDDQHGLGSDDFVEVRGGDITIQSATKDAIHTNEGYYQLGGAVEIVSSGSDGVDAGDGPVAISDGDLTVLNEDDDRDAVKCDGQVLIAGGTVDLTVEGDQSKAINAAEVRLTGGTVTIATSGGVVLEEEGSGYDPSYCTGIKADDLVFLDGCDLTITTTGAAGRGISCDGDITMHSGELTVTSSGGGGSYVDETGQQDAYHGPCLNADLDLTLLGGTVSLSHSGSGGKGISGDGDLIIGSTVSSPVIGITTTGSSIYIGGGEYAEAKAVSVDSLVAIDNGEIIIDSADDGIKSKYWIEMNGGLLDIVDSYEGMEAPNIYINGGELHVFSTDDGLNATYGNGGEQNDGSILRIDGGWVHIKTSGGDCIDSNGIFTMGGGSLIVHGPPNFPEVGLDVNGTFRIDGGYTIVSQVNGMMVETPSYQSSQRSVLLKRNYTLAGGTLFHIESTSGETLVTFRPDNRYSCVLFSSSELASGTTYRVYTGGTCTGTERDGVYTGGTYSGGTLRATFTSSGTVQQVSF